ncbi:MAG: hypothetical protein MSS28_01450 [Tenericutes bacterium]|nr:hypothetical protein [Mycoplasmatota bacterium]
MNLNFIINDYILIWNVLFQASVSEPIYKLKQKLWDTYKEQYNNTYKDRVAILNDVKNYIPNDDTIYNIILESAEYQNIRKEVEKYRLEVIKLWNKKISTQLKKITKQDFKEYTVYLIDNRLEILELPTIPNKDIKTIILGKKIPEEEPNKIIFLLLEAILKKEINKYKDIDKNIANAIIEMAIENELATNISNISHYWTSEEKLLSIKRQIYPFWLMYLGISKEEMPKYMNRDKIAFDVNKFPYEKDLKNLDITDFIDFCIQNKKRIIREEQLELI